MDNYFNPDLYHHGIKGMKWGVRRYQNKDGSLTEAGQRRYERDQRENAGKKKGNKVGAADPNRWVREDLERSKKLTDATSGLSKDLQKADDYAMKRQSRDRQRMDLSAKTDKELREEINRELLERQYNDVFNPVTVSAGRQYTRDIIDTVGVVLPVVSSSLAIALAIKELKG